ncbi:MAG: EscU/YscU/HrcU family type III secretion system export apparatus switch protein [Oscillospiraceae bacterium]|nr:EscU/YscU/HrcU family type III secretion system export apparatus switch protein [Oscillospiraceae bacterium]
MVKLDSDVSQKTEKPTRKRKIKARREGLIPVSREVISLFTLTVFFLVLRAVYPMIRDMLESLITCFFTEAGSRTSLSAEDTRQTYSYCASRFLFAVIPAGAAVGAAAAAATFLQTRFSIRPQSVVPDTHRISPRLSIGRVFSLSGLWSLTAAALKIVTVLLIILLCLNKRITVLQTLADMSLSESFSFIAAAVAEIITRTLAALTILAAADYLAEYIRHMRKIRMTKQEIKDEIKDDQADPYVRDAMLSRHNADSSVNVSDETDTELVICSDGGYAVALGYDRAVHQAPVVISSGKDSSARIIRARARKQNIAIFNYPELARAIFLSTKPGQKIPQKYYYAVAGMLAEVYDNKEKGFEVI